jgi:hypothetical protein
MRYRGVKNDGGKHPLPPPPKPARRPATSEKRNQIAYQSLTALRTTRGA